MQRISFRKQPLGKPARRKTGSRGIRKGKDLRASRHPDSDRVGATFLTGAGIKSRLSSRLATVALIMISLSISSCSKEDIDLANLNETIFVRHKNADMPARVYGNGSEKVFLIILHGGPGSSGLRYRANTIRTEIEKNNAVVYFDQRGSGSSQGNYAEKDVNIDIMAEDVLALAKVIKAKYGDDSKLFLMGHSWGGVLGPAALLKNQAIFSGWIDVNGAHDPIGLYGHYKVVLPQMANDQLALGNSVAYWEDVLEVVAKTEAYSLENFYTLNRIANGVAPILAKDKIINEAKADYGDDTPSENGLIVNWNKSRIVQILDGNGLNENVSYTDSLSQIKLPSMVLWGKYDVVVPTLYAQEAFDNLGACHKELFIFERSAHSPMYTEPELFATKVIDFINTTRVCEF